MFATSTATNQARPAASVNGPWVLPRPAYPDAPRIVETADRRTRELAEAMLRLNPEGGGCTETSLQLEGFSLHEQRCLGPVARRLANLGFVRQDAASERAPSARAAHEIDEELVAEALRLDAPLLRQLAIKLRARSDFDEDTLARLWPRIATGLASRLARAPLPARL